MEAHFLRAEVAEKILRDGLIQAYGKIVKNYFSIELSKGETNSNWLKRPFSNNQLSYAANDVRFLIEIHKKQIKALKKRKLKLLIQVKIDILHHLYLIQTLLQLKVIELAITKNQIY